MDQEPQSKPAKRPNSTLLDLLNMLVEDHKSRMADYAKDPNMQKAMDMTKGTAYPYTAAGMYGNSDQPKPEPQGGMRPVPDPETFKQLAPTLALYAQLLGPAVGGPMFQALMGMGKTMGSMPAPPPRPMPGPAPAPMPPVNPNLGGGGSFSDVVGRLLQGGQQI